MSVGIEELPQVVKEGDLKSEYKWLTRWETEERTMSQKGSEEKFQASMWLELCAIKR